MAEGVGERVAWCSSFPMHRSIGVVAGPSSPPRRTSVHALAHTPPKFCQDRARAIPANLNTRHFNMAATKEKKRTNGVKRDLSATNEPPAKKAKLLDNTDDEGSDSDGGGVSLKVNEEYARKYEHNKKRAEQFRRMHCHGRIPTSR
jgi:hypothetical protein